MAFLIGGANSAADTAYDVANSCRFNSGDSPSMTRDNGTPTNLKKFSISLWHKRAEILDNKYLIVGFDDESNRTLFQFASDKLLFQNQTGGSSNTIIKSNALYRDRAAWYHFCVIVDTTQATDTNRVKMYVNGSQVTSLASSTYPSQNTDMELTDATNSILLNQKGDGSDYNSGYYAEVVVLDGTAASITDFGEFDSDSLTIWKPKDVSELTFGTNGFYLDFEDSANLGNDANGGTDFTETNLAAADQATDTPTNNFCVMNVLDNYYSGAAFSEGNCKVVSTTGTYPYNTATFGVASGKWYWEVKVATSSSDGQLIGIANYPVTATNHDLGKFAYEYGYSSNNGKINTSGTGTTYGNSYTTSIISVALNLDDNEIQFYKDGTVQNSGTAHAIVAPASTDTGFYFPAVGDNGATGTYEFNFGGCPAFAISSGNADADGYGNFEYAVPSGFFALNTKNLGAYGG